MLDVSESGSRRSDIWLRFEEGILLLELKTRSNWDPAAVARQVDEQRRSKCRGEPVQHSVLLAPRRLIARPELDGVPRFSWRIFLDLARAIPDPPRILQLAIDHWSDNVETEYQHKPPLTF